MGRSGEIVELRLRDAAAVQPTSIDQGGDEGVLLWSGEFAAYGVLENLTCDERVARAPGVFDEL